MISNKPSVKGIAFGGCSFTWGQGLYYYSNLPSLSEPAPDTYDPALLTTAHIKFMESVRYPRLVANHFKTWEAVAPFNGGSNSGIIRFWKSQFDNILQKNHPDYYYNELGYFVFQITQHHRDSFIMDINGFRRETAFYEVSTEPMLTNFTKWLVSQNLTLDQWMSNYIKENISNVEQFLRDLESKGIKVIVMCWPSDPKEYLDCILSNPWISERLIKFNYKDKEYSTIQEMMKENKELEIKHDSTNFEETPKDHHPSLLCHQVMAEHIIKAIENGNNSL